MSHISEQFFTWHEAAKFIGVTTRTLARWYAEGKGPPRIKVQRQILYSKESLVNWLREQEVTPCRS